MFKKVNAFHGNVKHIALPNRYGSERRMEYRHPVQIYYEDTDVSGVVYHANYLKYFERAREHIIGGDRLAKMLAEEGIGFVVYKATMTFKEGAELGDLIEIRTVVRHESEYRAAFEQRAFRGEQLLVDGEVELVCVDADRKLVPLPKW